MTELFHVNPNTLSDAVRNAVVGRAVAGAYNREAQRKTIDACRAAARRELECQRLNPEQAAEVDELVAQTKAQIARGRAPQMVDPTTRGATIMANREDETAKMVLASNLRIERLLAMIVTLLMRLVGKGERSGGNRPAVGAGRSMAEVRVGGYPAIQANQPAQTFDAEWSEVPTDHASAPTPVRIVEHPAAHALPSPGGGSAIIVRRRP